MTILRRFLLLLLPGLLCAGFVRSASTDDAQYVFRSIDSSRGLSNNSVNAILQDRFGFMWFGTKDGLDRYDGLSFLSFTKEKGTLGNNFVTSLYEDEQGSIWIGTDLGVYIYSPQTESIRRFTHRSNRNTLVDNAVNYITGDKSGRVWMAVQSQGIFCYDSSADSLVHRQTDGSGNIVFHGLERICFDNDNVCWLDLHDGNLYYSDNNLETLTPVAWQGEKPRWSYSTKIIAGPYNCLYLGTVAGLQEINLTTKSVRTLLGNARSGRDDIFVRDMYFYSDDKLWVGTESGVYIYNLRTNKTTHLPCVEGDPYSISDNAVYALCKDKEGGMWIGTYFGGVNYFPKTYTCFHKFYPNALTDSFGKRVREFCADSDGQLWIGTEDKGLFHYNPRTEEATPFRHPAITHNVHGLCLDGKYLWVSNFAGILHRIDLNTSSVKNYDNCKDVFSICRTHTGQIYLGTTNGVMCYDASSDSFSYISKLSGVFIYYIKEDKQGNLWVATYVDGLYKWNVRTDEWKHFVYDAGNPKSLSSNKVLNVFEDSRHRIWITTQGGGFCLFNPETEDFTRYDSDLGLPSNVAYRIEEDDEGCLWVTTNKGLLHFTPDTREFKVYTMSNGLLSDQFNYQSSYKDKDGRIYFGCINGFISFEPRSFSSNNYLPPVVITSFSLFNKEVPVGKDDSPLKTSITLTDYLELKSNQNTFSFRVAALSYQSPDMNKLLYKLDGYDTEWYAAGKIPITYSNLPYRTYTLMVKGANSDGVWNPEMRMLKIRILPPFYLSVWAYVFYVLLAVGLLFGLITYFRRRTLTKHRYEMEKFEQKKERELYMAKIDFFTNVAHEIRTPLTLIKSPLESILKDNVLSDEVKVELEIMDQNAQRLLNLVNQLLDFRKTENKGFKLNPEECNLCGLMQFTCKRFTALAKQRGVNLTCQVPEKEVWASVDKEALTKIISNLLTNALKYGKTFARFQLTVDEKEEHFRVTASNDGKIIPLDMREEIFRPFVRYRDGKNIVQGTGIGLALARSLAELHHGKLAMDDNMEMNCFVLDIPIVHQVAPHRESEPVETSGRADVPDNIEVMPDVDKEEKEERPCILIVEDNKDMQDFIARQLSSLYNVLTAGNGHEAWDLLEQYDVDLVVSDIMMPEMDGLELCGKLKSDLNYNHIPIILLTAKTALESKIEGLEQGADAYIEKPFSVEYLRVNIANLLSNRERLRRRFIESPFVKAETVAQSKTDKAFMQKLNEYVNSHLQESELTIDDLADVMHMGRSNFYRKLKGMLGISPNEYLRLERLKKAAQLLKEGKCGIVEIAYMVGFSSPSYFSSCFKKQFGVLPKDFVQQ